MANVSSEVRKELEAQVIAKAWADEAFKKALIASPRTAVEKELGIKLPASLNVRVVEESADSFYLVIPEKNAAAERGELSDLELETVAGGKAPSTQKAVVGSKERNGAEYLKPEQ